MATPQLRTLDELLAEQAELNSRLEHVPTHDELCCALLDEVGELNHALKFGMGCHGAHSWCWWKRDEARATPREDVLSEIVDILHFLLIGLLSQDRSEWEAWLSYERMWLEPRIYEDRELRRRILTAFFKRDYYLTLLYLVQLTRVLGYTRAEYEDAYFAKTEINRERWKTA